MSPVAVIGAGSWGTALAALGAAEGREVRLWARRAEVARAINEFHRNPDYLSDAQLPASIIATDDLVRCLEGAECALIVTPSQSLRAVCEAIRALKIAPLPLLVCSKGIEVESGLLSTAVIAEVLGESAPVAVLSGPNHAEEIVCGKPAASVVASADPAVASRFATLLGSERFRTYVSTDPVGVQLCGAFKNVIAIAVGAAYGMDLGDNTAAMLITRGLAEMNRLVVACKGGSLTCMGLAGAGDVIVTCMSRHSRNRVFGEDYLARGLGLAEFERDRHMVVEGAIACGALRDLAAAHAVELPIANVVAAVMAAELTGTDAVHALAARPLTEEFYGL